MPTGQVSVNLVVMSENVPPRLNQAVLLWVRAVLIKFVAFCRILLHERKIG